MLKQHATLVLERSAQAAAFGRLCVETLKNFLSYNNKKAAAFGRLCVETLFSRFLNSKFDGSRLRAAVC